MMMLVELFSLNFWLMESNNLLECKTTEYDETKKWKYTIHTFVALKQLFSLHHKFALLIFKCLPIFHAPIWNHRNLIILIVMSNMNTKKFASRRKDYKTSSLLLEFGMHNNDVIIITLYVFWVTLSKACSIEWNIWSSFYRKFCSLLPKL